jgi:hypothetical protein
MLWNSRWSRSGCPRIGVRPEDTECCAVAIAPLGVQKRNLDIIRLIRSRSLTFILKNLIIVRNESR